MKIATWNVNSLRVRLPHVIQWLTDNPVDILCLQETKLTDDIFPVEELKAIGYHAIFSGQKTYNGVAILSRQPASDIVDSNPFYPDEQKRFIAATFDGVRVINIYVPNGKEVGSPHFGYKLNWLASLRKWLASEMLEHPLLAIVGDYNIAPEDRDVHDPAAWNGQILVSPEERHAFSGLIDLGLADAFRIFEQPAKSYSWWDYRQMAFARNRGLRIDHILLSTDLASRCSACQIVREPRKWERPSDHTPVVAELKL